MLVRKVEYPTHQNGPLSRLMFPFPSSKEEKQWEQREEEIKWTIDGLLQAVHGEDVTLYKPCREDGSPVGLIGWTTNLPR